MPAPPVWVGLQGNGQPIERDCATACHRAHRASLGQRLCHSGRIKVPGSDYLGWL